MGFKKTKQFYCIHYAIYRYVLVFSGLVLPFQNRIEAFKWCTIYQWQKTPIKQTIGNLLKQIIYEK